MDSFLEFLISVEKCVSIVNIQNNLAVENGVTPLFPSISVLFLISRKYDEFFPILTENTFLLLFCEFKEKYILEVQSCFTVYKCNFFYTFEKVCFCPPKLRIYLYSVWSIVTSVICIKEKNIPLEYNVTEFFCILL